MLLPLAELCSKIGGGIEQAGCGKGFWPVDLIFIVGVFWAGRRFQNSFCGRRWTTLKVPQTEDRSTKPMATEQRRGMPYSIAMFSGASTAPRSAKPSHQA